MISVLSRKKKAICPVLYQKGIKGQNSEAFFDKEITIEESMNLSQNESLLWFGHDMGGISLGGKGILILAFDKPFTDLEGNDLTIYEVGTDRESVEVSVCSDCQKETVYISLKILMHTVSSYSPISPHSTTHPSPRPPW